MRAAVFLCLCACAGSAPSFAPVASLPSAATGRYKDADAVVLQRRVTVLQRNDPYRTKYTEVRRHDLIQILSEAGFKYAQVRLWLGEDDELLSVSARTISPDGQEQLVNPEEVLEDQAKHGEKTKTVTKERVFRLPNVSVGSRIETLSVVGRRYSQTWGYELASDDIPVERFDLDVGVHSNIGATAAVFNYEAKIESTKEDGVWHFRTTLRNIPARDKSRFAEPWQDKDPWWAYRVTRFQFGNNYTLIHDTPEHAMRNVATQLYLDDKEWTRGLPRLLDASTCNKEPKCVVTKALATLRSKVALKSFASRLSAIRPLRNALDEKSANNLELAVLLRRMLEENGVSARYVLVGRADGLQFDFSFPLPNQFDHLMLTVDTPIPLFVDPACEHCEVGQLSGWVNGKRGVIISGSHSGTEGVVAKLQDVALSGTPPPIRGSRREHVIKLKGMNAEATATITNLGQDAVDEVIAARDRTQTQWRDGYERWLASRMKTAELVAFEPESCDREKAVCKEQLTYRVPSLLAADGDNALLPLELMYSGFDRTDRELTKSTMHVANDDLGEEVLNVELDKGWELGALPKTVSIKTPIVHVWCEATKQASGVRYRRGIKLTRGDLPPSRRDEVDAALRAFAQCRKELIPLKRTKASGR